MGTEPVFFLLWVLFCCGCFFRGVTWLVSPRTRSKNKNAPPHPQQKKMRPPPPPFLPTPQVICLQFPPQPRPSPPTPNPAPPPPPTPTAPPFLNKLCKRFQSTESCPAYHASIGFANGGGGGGCAPPQPLRFLKPCQQGK